MIIMWLCQNWHIYTNHRLVLIAEDHMIKFVHMMHDEMNTPMLIVNNLFTGIALAEKLQGLGEKYPKFYFLTYWVHSFYSVLYLAWKFWR